MPFARGSHPAVEQFGSGAVDADPIVPAEQVLNFVGDDCLTARWIVKIVTSLHREAFQLCGSPRLIETGLQGERTDGLYPKHRNKNTADSKSAGRTTTLLRQRLGRARRSMFQESRWFAGRAARRTFAILARMPERRLKAFQNRQQGQFCQHT